MTRAEGQVKLTSLCTVKVAGLCTVMISQVVSIKIQIPSTHFERVLFSYQCVSGTSKYCVLIMLQADGCRRAGVAWLVVVLQIWVLSISALHPKTTVSTKGH